MPHKLTTMSTFVGLFFVLSTAAAQTPAATAPAAPHTAACSPNKKAPTDADVAYWRGDYKKAADLYAHDVQQDEKDFRSKQGQIDALLAQKKLTEAAKLATDWTTTTTTEPYAILALADVRFAQGDWLESYAYDTKALKLNPCLAAAYKAMADFEELAAYRATARKHLALAHQLQPNDEGIRLAWVLSLPQERLSEELRKYVHESKSIEEKRRTPLLAQIAKFEAQKQNRCELVSSTGPTRFPMTPIYGGVGIDSWGIEVTLNGKKRTLQIDTGASGLLLSKSATTGIGLTKVNTSVVGGFGDTGADSVDIQKASSVHIGGLEFKNCLVDSLANFGVMGGGTEIGERLDETDGLIGADLFDHYLVTLDYIKHEVRLEPLPALPGSASAAETDPIGGQKGDDWLAVDRYVAQSMQNWTKIYRQNHLLILPTRIGKSGTKLFVADTGSDANLIDVNAAKEFTKSKEDILVFRGLSGTTRKTFETGNFTMDFAGLRLPVTSMSAMDLSRFDGVTGFIGYQTLNQLVMHLDYRDNLVSFEAPAARKM